MSMRSSTPLPEIRYSIAQTGYHLPLLPSVKPVRSQLSYRSHSSEDISRCFLKPLFAKDSAPPFPLREGEAYRLAVCVGVCTHSYTPTLLFTNHIFISNLDPTIASCGFGTA